MFQQLTNSWPSIYIEQQFSVAFSLTPAHFLHTWCSKGQNIPVYSSLEYSWCTNMAAFVKVMLAALLVVHLVCLVSANKKYILKRARRQGDQRPAHTQQGTV